MTEYKRYGVLKSSQKISTFKKFQKIEVDSNKH